MPPDAPAFTFAAPRSRRDSEPPARRRSTYVKARKPQGRNEELAELRKELAELKAKDIQPQLDEVRKELAESQQRELDALRKELAESQQPLYHELRKELAELRQPRCRRFRFCK